MIMRLSLPLVVLMLSACTNLNRDFSCDAKSGVGCKSISEVNTMVNTGQLQQSVSINSQQKNASLTKIDYTRQSTRRIHDPSTAYPHQ